MTETTDQINRTSAHWLLAKIGKKVLRPGGKELMERMLAALDINSLDEVVELAPGMGYTAKRVLELKPQSYVGVDNNEAVIGQLNKKWGRKGVSFIQGDVTDTGIASGTKSKVFGEAILTMHADHRKSKILHEAYRILKAGGLYAIHELALVPDDIGEDFKQTISKELSDNSKVNTRPLSIPEWETLLTAQGFRIVKMETMPMRLLEPTRMIVDEGLFGFLKISKNIISQPDIRKRVLGLRHVFREFQKNLCAVMILAKK